MEKQIEIIKSSRKELISQYHHFKSIQEKAYDLMMKAMNEGNGEDYKKHLKEENDAFKKYDGIRHAINDLGSALRFLTGEEVEIFWG